MSLNLTSFIKALPISYGKSDIETDMEASLENVPFILENWTKLSALAELENGDAMFHSKEAKDLVEEFWKVFGKSKPKIKLNKRKGLTNSICLLFENVRVNGEWLLGEISGGLNDVVMSQALNTFNANLMRSVPHFSFLTKYAMDLLNYLYIKETEYAGIELESDAKMKKVQEKFVTDNMDNFAKLIAVYGDEPKHFEKTMNTITRFKVPQDRIEEIVETHKGSNIDLFDNLPSGFVGSPIYSIRLIFAEWSANRHKRNKDLRKLLELRLLHYKLAREQGNGDVNTEKEIAYLSKRIESLDYTIAKQEEGVF